MEVNTVLTGILIAVFIVVGVALVILLLNLVKTVKAATAMMDKVEPTLKNVETITTDIQPALNKIEPMMDRVQLTVDTVNLEMMRVDQILEDVADITDTAAHATEAVDNITSAPTKAINNVATRVKTKFGGRSASAESAQLAEQRVAVGQALKEYEQAEKKEAKRTARLAESADAPKVDAPKAVEEAPLAERPATEVPVAGAADAEPLKSYVKVEEGTEPVIDPRVIAESPFFDDEAN